MTPMPKARFQQSEQNIAKHRTLVDSPEFQRGIDYALMQFAQALSFANITEEERVMGAAGLKLRGVHEFLVILKDLSEKPRDIKAPARNDNLIHTV